MRQEENRPLISLSGLSKGYKTKNGTIRAIDDISLDVCEGETVAVVGESGCGKTTLAMTILGLASADSGTIAIDGTRTDEVSGKDERRLRNEISVVFQNPHSSLNPKMRVKSLIGEPLISVFGVRGQELVRQVSELLDRVNLGREHLERYPHELSGGQMQRVAIARALALKPRLLLLDEPTAALDVSVQAQILKLLKSLQAETGVGYLFITHDLGTVEFIAHRVVVMYLGRVVETGRVADVFADPKHPYTKALLVAVPTMDPAQRKKGLNVLEGEIQSALNRPDGCAFSPRCQWRDEKCISVQPGLTRTADHRAFECHHPLPSLNNSNVVENKR